MANKKLVGLINGLLIFAVLTPILLSIYLAHHKASEEFDEELGSFAGHALIRTSRVIDQSISALEDINHASVNRCSPAHLQVMRQVSLNYRYIQEILYEQDGHIYCSSFQADSSGKYIGEPDIVGEKGFSVWYTSNTDLGFKQMMIYIGRPPHLAAIDPLSFIDVIPYGDQKMNIAVVSLNGEKALASSRPLKDQAWKKQLRQGMEDYQFGSAAYVIRRDNDQGLATIAWAPLAPLNKAWCYELLVWLPVGIGFSLAAGWCITRLLRRLQSPRARIADAIQNREFTVKYQPIVNLQTGESVGAEILLRWEQPDGSWFNPEVFIPLAEETGLITQITEQLVELLFTELGDWLHDHPGHHISINLAPCDLHSLHVLNAIRPLLAKYFVKPEQIAFEITERGFADPNVTAPYIAQLRRAGHQIFIDDFGTGYSSLSYLQNLDVDVLKIDKSFVHALEYKKVTPHIIEMAKALNISMVAEGIETSGQAAWLRQHGVQFGQGWLYSPALSKDEFIEWVARTPPSTKPDSLHP